MDAARQLRFLIPPFYLFASLGLGAILSGQVQLSAVTGAQVETVVAVGGVVLASSLPIGFLLGTASVLLLHLAFSLKTPNTYEVQVSEPAWQEIWKQLQVRTGLDWHPKHALYAAATFDHELLSTGIHEWLARRWNAFNVSANSCIALMLAFVLGALVPSIDVTTEWVVISVLVMLLLAASGAFAWRQTMRMLEFQAYRTQRGPGVRSP